MKLTLAFTLLCIMHISANTYAQTTQVSVDIKNGTFYDVVKQVEKQSEYLFFYNSEDIPNDLPISLQKTKSNITVILDYLVEKYNLSYKINDRHILLTKNMITQQGRRITGIVKDPNGEPIIGANVMEKGTTNGVVTDIDGKFMLTVSEKAIIQISYIGYISQDIPAGNRTDFSIILKEDSQNLEEVVVVGYGTQKKVNLTGAVETVKAKEIASKPVTSAAQALTGEMAGVTVIQRSSKPGAYDESIRIRGVGTWGNSNPLILIDGVELGLDKVNPNDIENVSVLKDAAAAAIYGSRAGNGVILITTKKGGKEGKPVINVSSNVGVQVITRMGDKQDALNFCLIEDKRLTNDKKSPKHTERIAKMQAGAWDPDHLLANTDWMDEITQAAFQQNHNISVSGGSKHTSYLASMAYLSQNAVVGNNTNFQRYNARLNTNSKITDWLSVDANMAYMTSTAKEPATGVVDVMKHAMNIEPYLPVNFSDGTYIKSGIAQNPVRMGYTEDYGIGKSKVNNFSGLISPEVALFGFKLKGLLAYEKQVSKGDTFTKTVKYNAFTPSGESNPVQTEQTTVAENNKKDNWNALTNLTLNATLSYEKTFGAHDLKVLLGASREELNSEYTTSSMSGFPNNDIDEIGAGTTKPSIAGGYGRTALSSYFGRINYVFNGRYLLEMNVRRDGSSKFARGHRWGTFPSGSLGWRISEESFFEPLKNIINDLKIRASYGKLGNNRIDDYRYLSTIASNISGGYVWGDSNIETGYYEKTMGNTVITWENLESTNFGVDMALFNNRLTVNADYFVRNTKDILLELPAPGTLGITPPTTNAAEVTNKGWELTLNWRDQIQDFKYNVSFNISDVQNEVTDLKGYKAPTNNLTILREGEPINAIFGWKSLGICRTQDDYEKYKKQMSGVSSKFNVGDIIYDDINKDGKIDGDDQTVIGNQIPRYTFGLRLGMEYKNFDFSCFLQGVGKCDGYLLYEAQGQLYDTHNSFDIETNVDGKYPRIMPAHYTYDKYSSFWVQDASYVRIKNIQLGYTFKMLDKYKISNLRLFFSGENIATFTKYDGFDPESPIGMRGWMYPLVGVYSLGLNLSF